MKYISIAEIAKDLGLTRQAVYKYCKEGFLPHEVQYLGNSVKYVAEKQAYLAWKRKNFQGVARGKISKNKSKCKEHTKSELKGILVPEWLDWLLTGKLSGRHLSPRTIELYSYYFDVFLKTLPPRPSLPVVSLENFRSVLGKFPAQSYSTKARIYDSVMSFSKFLIEKGLINKVQREDFRKLRPRRLLPAKKTVLNSNQYKHLVNAIDKVHGNSSYDKLLNRALVVFLAGTGLRAQECCNLKLEDIDLDDNIISVKLGKGYKNRKVGLCREAKDVLVKYLKTRIGYGGESFFVNGHGTPLTRKALYQKIKRLAKRAEIDITPHGLRRTFVTFNANKGHSLNHLRIACGHADLSTTQGYMMTTIDEVVEAMKSW